MLPLALKTALKVGVSGALSYAIAQFFGFSTSFLSPFIGGSVALAGELTGWFLLFQLTWALTLGVILGVIEYHTLGNNYISIFINVLVAGGVWRYFNTRGFFLGFCILVIKMASIIIMSSASDKVTMAYEMVSSAVIGIVIGLLINLLFWPTSSHEQLNKKLSDILQSISQLCEQILKGYLSGNYDEQKAQKLRLSILKTYQGSQVLFKKSLFDITGHQLGKTDWSSILKTEANFSLHLSALLHLVQTSQGINLPDEIKTDLKNITQSLMTCFSELQPVMMVQNDLDIFNYSLSQLNQDVTQFRKTLTDPKIRLEMKQISVSELLCFYGMVHRLEKLVNEFNAWGNQLQFNSSNFAKVTTYVK